MKQISDIIQNLINTGPALIAGLVFSIWFFGGLAINIFSAAGKLMPRPGIVNIVVCASASFIIYISRPLIHDSLQMLETPVYEGAYAKFGEDARSAAFESELQKKVSPAEFAVIQTETAKTAALICCKPSDIYAVAYSECGLNPFIIRKDGVAAGWIQFTSSGCGYVPGLSLEKVKNMCNRRDINGMMQATEIYLQSTSKGKAMNRPVDVYLAVFAPAFIGAPDNAVLYSGKNNPAYYLNSGLDGWTVRPDGRIVNLHTMKDYSITVRELGLCLESRAQQILK
jgi:hypothetical protein